MLPPYDDHIEFLECKTLCKQGTMHLARLLLRLELDCAPSNFEK
jgi:hypothetical protein